MLAQLAVQLHDEMRAIDFEAFQLPLHPTWDRVVHAGRDATMALARTLNPDLDALHACAERTA